MANFNASQLGQAIYAVSQIVYQSQNDVTTYPDYASANAALLAWNQNDAAFMAANPSAEGQNIHNNWLTYMNLIGWTYGATLNYGSKTHPLIVPWASVPQYERLRLKLCRSVISTLLSTYTE